MFANKKLALVFVFKIFCLWLVYLLANRFVAYGGQFPYLGFLEDYRLPKFIYSLANFDGIHYLLIARDGYYHYEQAFFPLYPILIKAVTFVLFNNHLVAGLIVSNLCFLLSLIILKRLVALLFPKKQILSKFFWLIFAFPTAFFFNAYYTESLFFLLLISSLYLLRIKKYFWAAFFAGLASGTRLVGIFLLIPFLFTIFKEKLLLKTKKSHILIWLFVLSPFVGLFCYMAYLWITVHDPFFFFNSQPAFGANRSTHLILLPQVYWRYLKIFFTSDLNIPLFISGVEFLLFNLTLVLCLLDLKKRLKEKNWFLVSIAIFSTINLLLPTLTGTLSSTPRYALCSLSAFFALSEIKKPLLFKLLLILFILLQVVLFALFVQGYFVS